MNVMAMQLESMAIRELKYVELGDTVRRAHALMDQFSVDQLPVLDGHGRLHSVVTRRRLALIRTDWGETLVSKVNWEPPEGRLRRSDTPLGVVFDKLLDEDFVLIADDGQTITGIVTINDVARFLYDQLTS